jgi:hypothetical protein
MKVHCQYSGIVYDITGFGSTQLTYVHPIFAAEPRWLLSRMGAWAAQKFTEEESKLLFLALLHSTELIEFRHAAQPENSTVQMNMETLSRFVGWMCGLSRPSMVLPKFVIQRDNRSLNNVRYWIQLWQDARTAFESGYTTQHDARKLRDKEAALERLIRNAGKSVEDYAGLLATWAFQATSVPKALQDYWRSLFCLKGVAVYNARAADLEEMLDHMEECLEHGSIYSHATLAHLRTLVKKNKAGLNYGLGITDEEFALLEDSPFRIVEGSVEEHNRDIVAASAPIEEPNAKDYPSRVAYLRAKAAWQLASRARRYAEDFTQQVETIIQKDERNSNLLAEEQEAETDEVSGDLFTQDDKENL